MKVYLFCAATILICAVGFILQRNSRSHIPDNNDSVTTSSLPRTIPLEARANPEREPQIKQTLPAENGANPANDYDLLERIKTALASGDPVNRDLINTNLLPALVEKDSWAAAHFAESLAGGPTRAEFMRRVAQLWAARDPASAESWAAQLTNVNERNSALSDVCFQVAQTDAHQALLTAEKYDLGKMPGAILENLAQQWAGQDFASAMAWVDGQPAGEQRDQMAMRLALMKAQTAPAEAAQLVVEHISPGPVQSDAALMAVHQWALRDFEGAKAWVKLFPEGELRDRAETELKGIDQYLTK